MTDAQLEKGIKLREKITKLKEHEEKIKNLMATYPTSLEVHIGYAGSVKLTMDKELLEWGNLNTFINPYWAEIKEKIKILEFQFKNL